MQWLARAAKRSKEAPVESGGGQLDMQQLFAAAAAMQSQLMNAQQELADAEVLGTAGGGLVTVTVNGAGELLDVTIQPDAIDPADVQESAQSIADLVLAAYRAACGAVDDLQQQKMGALTGGVPGMPDLSALTGLMGGGASPPESVGDTQPAAEADTGTGGAGPAGAGPAADPEAD
jgi:DNA-binding YbaB/EbfC family protein